VGAGIYATVEESARAAIQIRESMAPYAANARLYNRQYQIYRTLYPTVRELAHQLGAIGEETR